MLANTPDQHQDLTQSKGEKTPSSTEVPLVKAPSKDEDATEMPSIDLVEISKNDYERSELQTSFLKDESQAPDTSSKQGFLKDEEAEPASKPISAISPEGLLKDPSSMESQAAKVKEQEKKSGEGKEPTTPQPASTVLQETPQLDVSPPEPQTANLETREKELAEKQLALEEREQRLVAGEAALTAGRKELIRAEKKVQKKSRKAEKKMERQMKEAEKELSERLEKEKKRFNKDLTKAEEKIEKLQKRLADAVLAADELAVSSKDGKAKSKHKKRSREAGEEEDCHSSKKSRR